MTHSTPGTVDRLVLGTAGLAGLWGPVDRHESVATIMKALESGIRGIDTAPAYAEAESIVGSALAEWSGPLPEISTKAGRRRSEDPDKAHYDYSPPGIRASLEKSLRTMGLERVDVLFLHDPSSLAGDEAEAAIEELLRLKDRGLAGEIGIGGNFGKAFETHACSGAFSHFMGYNRYNIIRQDALLEEHALLKGLGIRIWQASPLYMGLLGSRHAAYMDSPPAWIPDVDIRGAEALKRECEITGLDMTGLALNFVHLSPHIDRMVIGASGPRELDRTLSSLQDATLRHAASLLLGGLQ